MSPFWNYDDSFGDSGWEPEPVGDADDIIEFSLDDEMLADRVAVALRRDPRIRGRRVEILVQNRVVILMGDVATVEARAAAARCVWEVPGVFDVCNRLGVAGRNGSAAGDWPR